VKALVTGSEGFVGRHLERYLDDEGDDVVGVDRHDVDITRADDVAALICRVRPEVVYHLAGDSDVGGSWQNPVETFRANAEGTLNVLTASLNGGVERVVSVSSADIYGRVTEEELPLAEDAPLRPVSPYAASKVAADFLALQSYLGHGLAVIRARPFNHIGPGQRAQFVAPALAQRIARNELEGVEEVPVGNLAPRRDFTDVRDVVRAYRLLALHGTPGEAYNVCRGEDIAVRDLAVRLVGMAHKPMRLVPDPSLQRPVDIPVLRGDPAKLRSSTGWEPRIPLEQTLADLLDEWRASIEPLPPEGP
jgi:GDP-4-dehydro-6-deoxy-D-mannose reductase